MTARTTFEPFETSPCVTFTDEETGAVYDTLEDWSLIWRSVDIEDAQARRYAVTIPGRDGVLDLSEALGGVYYENRNIALSFACVNYTTERFHLLAATIRNALDGKMCRVVLSDDSGYFWRGRPQVTAEWGGLNHTVIRISVDAEPFKYNSVSSYDPWLWDPFNFVTGVITQTSDIELSGGVETVTLPKDPARSKPTLWLNRGNARAKVGSDGTWKTLKSGANVFPEIRMNENASCVLYLEGSGSVGVEYRVGSL